jgi:hypothetical protein
MAPAGLLSYHCGRPDRSLMQRRPHIHNVHKERRKEAKEERNDGCS